MFIGVILLGFKNKKNADFPPTGKGMNRKTAGLSTESRFNREKVEASGGGKESRATERGMRYQSDLWESSSGGLVLRSFEGRRRLPSD